MNSPVVGRNVELLFVAEKPIGNLPSKDSSQVGHLSMTSAQETSRTYFVTGCAGFIASRVAGLLLDAGHPDMSIFRFIRWIDDGIPIELFGDGEQSRDFTYVDDIARGTVMSSKKVGYEVINLGGGGTPISLNTLIGMLEDRLGKKATIKYLPFHKADMMTTSADITKAGELLDWKPQVSLEQGLDESVRWYQTNKPWSQEIVLP